MTKTWYLFAIHFIFGILVNSTSASDLSPNLEHIYKVAKPSFISIADSCLRGDAKNDELGKILDRPFLKEACDHVFYRLSVTYAHLSRDRNADPSFFSDHETPPLVCERRNTRRFYERDSSFYCVFNGLRESLKYELHSLFIRACLKEVIDKKTVNTEWKRLSALCKKEKDIGDYFSCFFSQTKVSGLTESFRNLARLANELSVLKETCLKTFPNGKKNHCGQDDYLLFTETIRYEDMEKANFQHLSTPEAGFEFDGLPDYYALYNSCDKGKTKRKRFVVPPVLRKQDVVQCGETRSASGPLNAEQVALYKSLCAKAETSQDPGQAVASTEKPTIELNAATISKVIDRELENQIEENKQNPLVKKSLEQFRGDQKYLDAMKKKYLKFSEKLKKQKLEDEDILFEVSEDYSHALDAYVSELKGKQVQKIKNEMFASPSPSPVPEDEEDPEPIIKVKMPVTEDLKKLSRMALSSFKKGEKDKTNYAAFFAQLEADGELPLKDQKNQSLEIENKWKPYQEKYSKIGLEKLSNKFENVKKLLIELNKDLVSNYHRSKAKLSNLLDEKQGNCEARMKAVLSALAAADLRDVPNYQPVIQFYEDHVQVALYNKKTGAVLDAITGQTQPQSDVDLYDPRVIYLGYLEKAGERSELKTDDFIVAKIAPHEDDGRSESKSGGSGGGPRTNTNLNSMFPKSKKRFSRGPIPLRGKDGVPEFVYDLDAEEIPDGAIWDQLHPSIRKKYKRDQKEINFFGFSKIALSPTKRVKVFKDSKTRERYFSLDSSEAEAILGTAASKKIF